METPTRGKPREVVPLPIETQNGNTPLPAPTNTSDRDRFPSRPAFPRRRTAGVIASFLQFLKGGRRQLMELAHLAGELDPRIVPIIEDWDRMKPALRNAANLDALCEAHDVAPDHFLATVGEAELRARNEMSIFIAALNIPFVVERSIKTALTKNGVRDREMLFEHAGFLPVPGSKRLRIINHAAVKAELSTGDGRPLPRLEDTVEMIEEAMQDN
jgi:hypothetical protein